MTDLAVLSLPFLQRALVLGLMLSALMATLGVLVVLRRMSFFADAIGHSALTGIALGLLLKVSPFLAALIFALLVAAGITAVRFKTKLHLDTLLGIFFSASVALGVIVVQLTPGFQADLLAYLFGDILIVTATDLYLTAAVAAAALIITMFAGKTFVAIAFDADLARVEGAPVAFYELLFLLLLAAVIALAIKLVGIVLVTALLVIPAASAQNITRSLTGMFLASLLISLLATTSGMVGSALLNTASGPTIVLVNTLFFALSLGIKSLRSKQPARTENP